MIRLLRWFLLPISLLYHAVIWMRNWLYDHAILRSNSFRTPTIVVGNLAIGGAGKSPMTEQLIRLLKEKYKIATLSRGYGRKTKGFKYVEIDSSALDVGDEPLQFKKKFPEITVSVCEDRCKGVAKLETNHDIIVLDDAYQHRRLKGGLNILLLDFASLFQPLITLPTGNLRDVFSSSKRANLIVITKCPKTISEEQRKHIATLIKRYSEAPIHYSYIQHEEPKNLSGETVNLSLTGLDIILFCGIANPAPLKDYLNDLGNNVHLLQFPDHHQYSSRDLQGICTKYDSIKKTKKVIITTEKDLQRININLFEGYPVFYIPITAKIYTADSFNQHVLEYASQAVIQK